MRTRFAIALLLSAALPAVSAGEVGATRDAFVAASDPLGEAVTKVVYLDQNRVSTAQAGVRPPSIPITIISGTESSMSRDPHDPPRLGPRMDAIAYLALLRGVNVGGQNRLPMKDLAAMFVAAGCHDVRTYIQSGNVLFVASPSLAATLPARITDRIEEAFGYRTPLVLRTAGQLAAVAGNNPFPEAGDSVHVLFLADLPDPGRVASLDPDRAPPDAFLVRGQEVFLHCPNGLARTRLTNAYFDSKLATLSTARNWRTVTRLLALMGGQAGTTLDDLPPGPSSTPSRS